MEEQIESYLAFSRMSGPEPGASVFFLPTVLEGRAFEAPVLTSVQDIAGQNDCDCVRPQFKRMFWHLLELSVNGKQAIKRILVFDNSMAMRFPEDVAWGNIGDDIVLILHQGLYPGKKIVVYGITKL